MSRILTRQFRRKASVEGAMRRFLKAIGPTTVNGINVVPIGKARGRVLAQPVVAGKYLPPFDVSVVDGYAVRSPDLHNASLRSAISLKLKGESRLGETCRLILRKGEAVAVATGSMTPKGADAVVMAEHVRELSRGRIQFQAPVDFWQNITRKGEDVSPGVRLLGGGALLRPEDIGALKALGFRTVQVRKVVRVGLLSTGNELVESVKKGNSAKIVDLNRPILSGMLEDLGAQVVDLGIVRDDTHAIKAALRTGLAKSDMVLVTAGSSVGRRDLVPTCINSLGRPGMLVHGVAMRPAMPTGLALVGRKPVVSLPGFPVSAIVAFRVFVRPLLARLAGGTELPETTVNGVLEEKITVTRGVRSFVRVRVRKVGREYRIRPLKLQRSSILSSMVRSNGIITVPESVHTIRAGAEVSVVLTGGLA